jgi:homoaconitase/3-isopropylmalate dehydratase large subunit
VSRGRVGCLASPVPLVRRALRAQQGSKVALARPDRPESRATMASKACRAFQGRKGHRAQPATTAATALRVRLALQG